MAYTEVSFEDASDIVRAAGLSELVHLEKLSGGWANSNYKLSLADNLDKKKLKLGKINVI